MYSYFNSRKQRVKINDKYSSFEEKLFGVPQGSILGSLLFNIFISDHFLNLKNIKIASYADDNTPYCSYKNFGDMITCLERTADDQFTWFNNNGMKANADKCHLLLSTKETLNANVSNYTIINSDKEKLLGVTIDKHLKLESHIKNLSSKANLKLYALSRVSLYMSLNQHRMIMQPFITSQFGFCALIWRNHNRSLNNNINRIHERALRIVYRDKKSTFKELLEIDNSVTVHVKNLQVLVTEMYKLQNNCSSEIMNKVFPIKEPIFKYDLRNTSDFTARRIKTVQYGSESLSYLGPRLWNIYVMNTKRYNL